MGVTLTRAGAGAGLAAWARQQLDGGADGAGVVLWAVVAIGDLLVDGVAVLPDLRAFRNEDSGAKPDN